MSSSLKLQQASDLLLAALQLAQAERDQALFELASGQRSQRELQRLSERVALLANLLLQARALLPAQGRTQFQVQPQPPSGQGCFRPGEHWQRGQVRYRVESCPLIPSCVRLWPTGELPANPIHRHPGNTTHFRRIHP